jgi:hypothetical protein
MIDCLEKYFRPCFIKSHFGFECPGCGMQRAAMALLKGDLVQSLYYNPALFVFMLSILALLIQLKLKHPKGGSVVQWMFLGALGIMLVNFGIKFL